MDEFIVEANILSLDARVSEVERRFYPVESWMYESKATQDIGSQGPKTPGLSREQVEYIVDELAVYFEDGSGPERRNALIDRMMKILEEA